MVDADMNFLLSELPEDLANDEEVQRMRRDALLIAYRAASQRARADIAEARIRAVEATKALQEQRAAQT